MVLVEWYSTGGAVREDISGAEAHDMRAYKDSSAAKITWLDPQYSALIAKLRARMGG